MRNKIKLSILLYIVVLASALSMSSCEKEEVFSPNLALNTDTLSITKDEITSNVLIFSNTSWRVEIEDAQNTEWLTLLNSDSLTIYNGSGRSYFQFKAEANDNNVIRYGTFVIKTAQNRKTLVVVQNR